MNNSMILAVTFASVFFVNTASAGEASINKLSNIEQTIIGAEAGAMTTGIGMAAQYVFREDAPAALGTTVGVAITSGGIGADLLAAREAARIRQEQEIRDHASEE